MSQAAADAGYCGNLVFTHLEFTQMVPLMQRGTHSSSPMEHSPSMQRKGNLHAGTH
jgi:hypothetical protein